MKKKLFTMWFQDFVTVFNQSYNCQTSHYLGRNRLPEPLLLLLSLVYIYLVSKINRYKRVSCFMITIYKLLRKVARMRQIFVPPYWSKYKIEEEKVTVMSHTWIYTLVIVQNTVENGWQSIYLSLMECIDFNVQGVLCLRCFLRLWKNNHESRKPCKWRSDLVPNGHIRVPK